MLKLYLYPILLTIVNFYYSLSIDHQKSFELVGQPGGTVVQHLPYYSKVEGSSPAADGGYKELKWGKKS